MAPQVTLKPIKLATSSLDKDACLICLDGDLAAVVVRLEEEDHDELLGSWFLEIGFGPCEVAPLPTFSTIEHAQAWVIARYKLAEAERSGL